MSNFKIHIISVTPLSSHGHSYFIKQFMICTVWLIVGIGRIGYMLYNCCCKVHSIIFIQDTQESSSRKIRRWSGYSLLICRTIAKMLARMPRLTGHHAGISTTPLILSTEKCATPYNEECEEHSAIYYSKHWSLGKWGLHIISNGHSLVLNNNGYKPKCIVYSLALYLLFINVCL